MLTCPLRRHLDQVDKAALSWREQWATCFIGIRGEIASPEFWGLGERCEASSFLLPSPLTQSPDHGHSFSPLPQWEREPVSFLLALLFPLKQGFPLQLERNGTPQQCQGWRDWRSHAKWKGKTQNSDSEHVPPQGICTGCSLCLEYPQVFIHPPGPLSLLRS